MTRALVDNTADQSQVKDGERVARREQRQEMDDLRDLSNTPAGERFLAREIKAARVLTTSFTTDPLAIAFAEGRRNAGLRLLALLAQANAPVAARVVTSLLTTEATA